MSNQLAARLRRLGVAPNTRVAVSLNLSVEAVVGLLGVLKSGGVYLPIDSRFPSEWRNAILADSKPSVLLTQHHLRHLFEPPPNDSIRIESDWETLAQESGEQPAAAVWSLCDQACMFYSAARSIRQIGRQSLSDRLFLLREKLRLTGKDVFLDKSPLPFSDTEIYMLLSLSSGSQLAISSQVDEDLSYLSSEISSKEVTVLRLTATGLSKLLNSLDEVGARNLSSLRLVLCSGEPLRRDLVDRFFSILPECELHHCYAPPEAGREVAWHVCKAGETKDFAPVGRPFGDVTVRVLDRNRKLAPIGLAGEIFVAGQGLSQKPENQVAVSPGKRLYPDLSQTEIETLRGAGDLGRWLSNGSLELLKTNGSAWFGGTRIHFREIERVLLSHPAVSDCVVRAREATNHSFELVAYVVLSEPQAISHLRAHLEKHLPLLLVPRLYLPVAQLPLNAVGQVDEEKLASLEVIEESVIAQWARRLQSISEIGKVAVVMTEQSEASTPLALSGLLPKKERRSFETAGNSARRTIEEVENARTAISDGEPITAPLPETLVHMLEAAARIAGQQEIVYLQANNKERIQSYSSLFEEAGRIATGLRGMGLQPGEKVILQLEDNRDFLPGFWGCIFCGCIPVPISIAPTYKEANSVLHKLRNAWKMLDRPLILTSSTLQASISSISELLDIEGLKVETVDKLRLSANDGQRHQAASNDPALILLTSGSTGMPKGVVLSHSNIISRSYATSKMNGFSSEDVSLNWLPMDHVGGIVMFHIRDVFLRCKQAHAATSAFLERPLNWLDWIDRYRATITWAPNFAYALVNGQIEKDRKGRWDLSSMRFILNAGEAIVPETASRFLENLVPYGLPPSAMHPAWGMSETSSAVTYSDNFRIGCGANLSSFVEVGKPVPGVSIRIVDSQGNWLKEGQVGRLQVRGRSVTEGYFKAQELNAEVFTHDGWFTTGDLGFILNGALTITGREKDVIIINGVNYYSHEIEGAVEGLSGVSSSFTAACAVRDPGGQTDKLAIFFNSVADDPTVVVKLFNEIREKVVGDIGINPSYLIPVDRSSIPKTEIGKIQRSKLRERLEAGEFDAVLHIVESRADKIETVPDWFYERKWAPKRPSILTDNLSGKRYLIFMDRAGMGEDLADALMSNGATCTRIYRGAVFEKRPAGEYVIDPCKQEHFDQIFASLADERVEVYGVIHLWPLDNLSAKINSIDALRDAQRNGVYSLLFAARSFAKVADPQQPVYLYVVTCRMQPVDQRDPVAWENGGIRGFVRTVSQEMPWVRCLSLDLEDTLASKGVENILSELQGNHTEIEVAFRGGKRLVQRLSKVEMLGQGGRSDPIQEKGLYLITGGLGGIGVELARYLIEQYDAKLILLGRTPLEQAVEDAPVTANGKIDRKESPSEKGADRQLEATRQTRYQSLRTLTDGIIYKAADVCDLGALQDVVAEAERRWGTPLTGIFHLAGEGNLLAHWEVFDRHSVLEETVEGFEAMFRSKVYGAWTLSQLLSARQDAFLVTFSSINGVLGGVNFGAYSAANSFLENFSAHNHRTRRGGAYCFSWTIWDNIGMSEGNPDYAMDMVRSHGYHVISRKQGINSLLAALARNHEHLIIGLNGANHNVRRHLLPQNFNTRGLAAYYTVSDKGGAPVIFKDMTVKDRFGAATSCQMIQLSEMPLTSDGQLDVAALPSHMSSAEQQSRIAPRTDIEKALASIWGEVLQIEQLGVENNFFSLGGHSLLAMQILSRIRDAFQIDLPLRTLFESPTIAEMAERLEVETGRSDGSHIRAIKRADRGSELPLSFAQQRLWFLTQLDPTSAFYNIPVAVKLSGRLKVEALRRAVDELINRHEALRTVFISRQGRPIQMIKEPAPALLRMGDISQLSRDRQIAEVEEQLREEADTPFDLIEGPLVRGRLLKVSEEEHVLMFTVHHIVSDGWSTGVMVREIGALYEAYSEGKESPLSALGIQYADYAVWQREWLQGEALQRQLDYWRGRLADVPVLSLPTDRPRPLMQSFQGARRFIRFDEEQTGRLRELSRSEGVTMFMVLLAGFQVLLQRYSGQDDILVGSPIAGRSRAELEPLIGFFVNTLVLRTNLSGDLTVKGLLGRVREVCLGAYAHQDLPFEQLVDELQPERDLSRNPLFQVMLVLQETSQQSSQFLHGLAISPLPVTNTTAKFDLTLLMEESEEHLSGVFEYCTELFHEDTIKRMSDHLIRLLDSMSRRPDRRVIELPLMSESEINYIISELNQNETHYPKDKLFHNLFEEQVEKYSDAVALSFNHEQLTYRELNARADRLATRLRSLRVGPESLVGVYMERGIETLIGILGIFKAGGMYAPLETNYPEDRLRLILDETRLSVLLTCKEPGEWARRQGVTTVRLDKLWLEPFAERELENPAVPIIPENSSYVIYTSGSAGLPKGAMIKHQGMLNHLFAKILDLQLSETDVIAQTASPCFDISVWQFLSALLVGGQVRIFSDEIAHNPNQLLSQIARSGVSVLEIVPSLLRAVLDQAESGLQQNVALSNLRWLLLTGEALPPDLCQRWLRLYPGIPIVNAYGPTECSDDVAHYFINEPPARGAINVPIGKPVANTQLYILDSNMNPVLIGATGELCVGGDGVGRGYINNPAQTASAFFPAPFAARSGERIYKTGDLAKYLADGRIEFLGRMDHQVKLRGYRIELGEIESTLRQHGAIKEAVVLAKGESNNRLVAYLVSGGGENLPAGELKEYLRHRLPEYMVPSAYVWMKKMPVTTTGKLDRTELPEPGEDALAKEQKYVAPTGEVERSLAEIWSKVIGVETVGVHDNFFELGGDSLKLTQVQALIQQGLNAELSLADMFRYPTVQLLAQRISIGEKAALTPIGNENLDVPKAGKQNLLHQRRQRVKEGNAS
jgi:amino acid adenylation domain-containing protein